MDDQKILATSTGTYMDAQKILATSTKSSCFYILGGFLSKWEVPVINLS